MTQREFQEVRDELFLDGLIFQKSDNLASRLLELDMNYPFGDSSVAMDAITSENQQLLWKEVNKVAKKLSQKLHDKVHADDNVFTVHYGFNVSGVGKGEKTKYQPFTLEFDDGQILTVLARNIKDFKNYKPNKDVIITHFMLNNKDITKGIYKNGDTDIDTALTVARLKKIIEASHRKFVANNIDDDELKIKKLEKEIDGMKLDLSDVVTEAVDETALNDAEKIQKAKELAQAEVDSGEMRAFAQNPEAMKLLEGNEVGEGTGVMEAYNEVLQKAGDKEANKIINDIKENTYTINLPTGSEKYITVIREAFAKDEKLKGINYVFTVGGATMDAIDKKEVSIEGVEKSIQTHMKKVIHFITIGADKIEGKSKVDMPSVDLIRNAEFIKEKTGLDYEVDHHQYVSFITAEKEFSVGEDGRGSIMYLPIGNKEGWSVKERWLSTDRPRKVIIEKINEELAKDKQREDDDMFDYDRDAVNSTDLLNKNTDIIRNFDELKPEEKKALLDADRWDMVSTAHQFVAYGEDGRASVVGIYGNVKKGTIEVGHLELKGERKRAGDPVKDKLEAIKGFMSEAQYSILSQNIGGEEYEFNDVVNDLYETITTMPKTGEQGDKGDDAVAYLHYFKGGSDWYIIEKDMYDEQLQAFGYAILNGDREMAELGYINIEELTRLGVELDFYYTKQTLGEIKGAKEEDTNESNGFTDQELEAKIKDEVYRFWMNNIHGYSNPKKNIDDMEKELDEIENKINKNGLDIKQFNKSSSNASLKQMRSVISGWKKDKDDLRELQKFGDKYGVNVEFENKKSLEDGSYRDIHLTSKDDGKNIPIKGLYPTMEKAKEAILNFGNSKNEYKPTDKELIKQIKENEVYKQIIKDSHGGVMYNVANADKYDAREILALWELIKHKDAMGGIIRGAMNFLIENQTKTEDDTINHAIKSYLEQVAEYGDSEIFEKKLDEVAELIEKKGLMDKYEDELNKLADQLTELMKSENE